MDAYNHFCFWFSFYIIILTMETLEKIKDIIIKAFDQTDVSYFITDKEGKIIYVNSAFEKNTQYKLEEVKGKTPSIIKSGKHNKEYYFSIWNTILKGDNFAGRMINKRKDGSIYTVLLKIIPIKLNGDLEFFLAREENIDDILELERKLIESQKLEAISSMTGELAHDFNNLLTVIIGSMELISEDLKKDTPTYNLSVELLKSAKEQANIIKQLLIFSRKSTPELKILNLNALITEFASLIKSQITARIKLNISLGGDLRQVKADESLIKQAILNLTANSRDAISSTGEIEIKTYNYDCNAENIEPYHIGKYSVIEINDTGGGISESVLPHIFEPFFTTKKKGKGTGLGLSSVYGIIKNHNGYVYASNKKDNTGACFKIYLPSI